MHSYLLVVHVVLAFFIVSLVLLQHGKGAEVGASFGSGASNTIFGSKGSGSFLAKATIILALLFAVSSISLTKLASTYTKSDVIDVKSLQNSDKKTDAVKQPEIPISENTSVISDPLFDSVPDIGMQTQKPAATVNVDPS